MAKAVDVGPWARRSIHFHPSKFVTAMNIQGCEAVARKQEMGRQASNCRRKQGPVGRRYLSGFKKGSCKNREKKMLQIWPHQLARHCCINQEASQCVPGLQYLPTLPGCSLSPPGTWETWGLIWFLVISPFTSRSL